MDELVESVVWEVKAGAYLPKLKKMFKEAKAIKPDIVIIEIGSNDLTRVHPSPQRLALEVVQELQRWTSNIPEIKKIVICQITNKGELLDAEKDCDTFNDDVECYNQELCCMIRHENRIIHWRHKRLYRNFDDASDDGTHLDTIEGKRRYKISIYGAIREAARQIRRGLDARVGRKAHREWWGLNSAPIWYQHQRALTGSY